MSTNALRLLIILAIFPMQHQVRVQMTKMVCTAIDKAFSRIEVCDLIFHGSKVATTSFAVKLLQPPLTNIKVHMEFTRLEGKRSITILNNTWDMCKFLKTITKFRPLRIFYELFKENTNLNHSCPYYGVIRVMNFAPRVSKFAIPLPDGRYKLQNWYIVDGKERITVLLLFMVKN